MSISLMDRLRFTMKLLFTLTRSFTQGSERRLSPMAISHVVAHPESMSSTSSNAESRTMSRWLLMNVWRLPRSMAEKSASQPRLALLSSPLRKS